MSVRAVGAGERGRSQLILRLILGAEADLPMDDPHKIPIAPLLLGLAGLVPFWALTIGLLLHVPPAIPAEHLATILATYGAIILSFLGGVRWGSAMTTVGGGMDYVLSIMPSLVGWALVLAPDPWRLVGLGLVLLVSGPIDLQLVKAGRAPFWFGRLRLVLSSGAGVAMLLAAGHAG